MSNINHWFIFNIILAAGFAFLLQKVIFALLWTSYMILSVYLRRSNCKRTEIMLTILISAALTCMQLQAISHFEPAKLCAPHVLVPWKLLTWRLPHLSYVTRITIFCLVNVATFMTILQLFEYLTLNIIILAFSVIFVIPRNYTIPKYIQNLVLYSFLKSLI